MPKLTWLLCSVYFRKKLWGLQWVYLIKSVNKRPKVKKIQPLASDMLCKIIKMSSLCGFIAGVLGNIFYSIFSQPLNAQVGFANLYKRILRSDLSFVPYHVYHTMCFLFLDHSAQVGENVESRVSSKCWVCIINI